MKEFKNGEELYELKLLYDNIVAENENTKGKSWILLLN